MKKLLALLLSVMMMGSVLTACGKDDDNKNKKKDNSKDSSDSVIAKDLEFTLGTDVATPAKETVGKEVDINEEELKKALTFDMSKEFTMSYNMITAEAEYPIVLTTNGKDMYIKMNMFGTEMIILVLDGKAYGISDANKVYSVEDVGDEATEDYFSGIDISEELAEYSELVTKAEEVTIDGNKLTRYTVDSDNT
ncbi:MAG: hypothetical protein GX896_03935, partial [Clostridiales bacterium]|nr:hypothetical protein [Clostridiales bacterium]